MSILDQYRNDLTKDIDDSLGLIRTVNSLLSITELHTKLSVAQSEQILEWAFVNVHTSWENFIEDCFLAYMLDSQTLSGYKPVRYVFPKDEQHALGLILAGREFFQWTRPRRIAEQAELCFKNGEPFSSVIESAATDLVEMTTIRNAIVHRSTVSTEKFKTLVRNKLITAPLNITPGQFLATLKPETTRTTFISGYYNKLKVIAGKIVPV